MNLLHLFEGMTTPDSLLILAALTASFFLGGFATWYFWRQKADTKDRQLRKLKSKLSELEKNQVQPTIEPVTSNQDNPGILQVEFEKFRNEFQDSLEFYMHRIEDMTESNQQLSRKIRALEIENEQLIKAIWSDDMSYNSFKNSPAAKADIPEQDHLDEVILQSARLVEDDEVASATSNIKNWLMMFPQGDQKDVLSKIKGISQRIEEKLNSIGIENYHQLSQLDDALIDDLAKAINYFPARIKTEDWVGQAYLIAKDSKRM